MHRHLGRWLSRRAGQTDKESPSPGGRSRLDPAENTQDSVQGVAPDDHKPTQSPASSPQNAGRESLNPSPQTIHESPYGLKELISQPAEKENAVDIIAIHGLNGHREKTWTSKTTGLNWLSDASCLPKDIPNARVSSFGYNSASYFSRGDSDVRDFASELLAAVRASRKSQVERRRPIIVVCHSLGGLVFKQAVIKAHEQDHFYASLLESIQGVVFFATPHRGSDLAFWDSIGTRLAKAATLGFTTNTRLSKGLKVDSEMLKRISDSFAYRGGGFKIRSFYETELMPGLNCRVVDRDSARLGWSNELDIASPANHSSVCKFPSPADQRYQTAVFAILDMIGMPDESVDLPFTNREESCMDQLNADYQHHLGQIDDPVPGTCEWILSHEKWQQWQSWPGSSLLWFTSSAGCGKSVMAKFLVDYFQAKRGARPFQNFGYFFFMDGIGRQDNASAAVSALLHQMYCLQHGLIKYAMRKFEGAPTHVGNRFSTLWSILIDSINDSGAEDVLWVLDGLDECEEQSLRQFIRALSSFFDSHTATDSRVSRCSLKIILLSRPSSLIQQFLGLFTDKDLLHVNRDNRRNRFRLAGEDENQAITTDIVRFAQWKVGELASASALPGNVLERLHKRLVAGADFTFLWISLVIKMVEDSTVNGISVAQLEKILNTTNLNDVYRHLLEGTCRAFPEKTRKLLSIVLAAFRPLTVEEMCVAVEAVEDYEAEDGESSGHLLEQEWSARGSTLGGTNLPKNWDEEVPLSVQPRAQSLEMLGQQLHRPFDNHIRQLCGHFIRIRRRKLYFVHQTARSFLINVSFELDCSPHPARTLTPGNILADHVLAGDPSGTWRPIKPDQANQTLLNVCVSYIRMFEPEKDGEDSPTWDDGQLAEYLEQCRTDPPRAFFPYAALHWIQHYRPVRKALNFQYDELLQPGTSLFKAWIRVHSTWTSDHEKSPGAVWLNDEVSRREQSLELADTLNIYKGSLEDLEGRYMSLRVWVRKARCAKKLPSSAVVDKLGRLRQVLDEQWIGEGGEFYCMVHDSRDSRMEGQRKQLQEDRLRLLQHLTNELEEERRRALEKDPEFEAVVTEQEGHIRLGFDKHLQDVLATAKQEEDFYEVLMHFDLLGLEEAGLEEDEFLSEYWQSRVDDLRIQRPVDDEEGGYNDEEIEGNIPNRIKHYIRERTKLATAGSRVICTPGAQVPELSNPETRFFDDSMGLPRIVTHRRSGSRRS